MPDGFYVAMGAATARTRQLDAVADALANAQTPGFRQDQGTFQALLGDSPDPSRSYVAAVATGVDSRPGVTETTGRPLDVVPQAGAFFAVKMPDNTVGYTRAGRLEVDGQGVVRASGNPVLNASMLPIQLPPGAVPTMQQDGQLLANGQPFDVLGTWSVDGPLSRVGPSTLRPDSGRATAVVPLLNVGTLEYGAVSALDATVQMVTLQRQFENATQALQTYKRLDQGAVELGRVR
jgi:flagellar basal-body rod protein FlgF